MISKRNFGLPNFNYFRIGGIIKFKTLPKWCNIEGMDGNLLQNIVLKSFRLEGGGGYFKHKASMEGACMFQGQIGKITPETPGRLGNFSVLALFFHLSLPKIWLTHPHKNYIFETLQDRTIISQSLAILAL